MEETASAAAAAAVAPAPPPARSPRASSVRWEILRRAFLSASQKPTDCPSEMGIESVSRKTSSGFNMIPCHLQRDLLTDTLDDVTEIEGYCSPKDVHICYSLPIETSPELILLQRTENCVDLNDFEISNKHNVDSTGLVCRWPSEDVLAYFCLNNAELFRSKRVLELGSGYGLAGFAIAAGTDAYEVVISDGNPQVVEYIQRNVTVNTGAFGDTKVQSMILHWNKELDSSILNTFDIIVASDCTFFKEFHESLAFTVKSLLRHSKGSEAIFLNPKRGDSMGKFLEKARNIGLNYELVENYDNQVWTRHLNILNGKDTSWPNYDMDHCYPILVRITL